MQNNVVYASPQSPNPDAATPSVARRRNAGFGLIDTLIAISILVIAILAMQSSIISNQLLRRLNDETNFALNLARWQTELVKSKVAPYDNIDSVFDDMAEQGDSEVNLQENPLFADAENKITFGTATYTVDDSRLAITFTLADDYEFQGAFEVLNEQECTVIYEDVDDTLKRIIIQIEWRCATGRRRTLRLATCVAES